MGGDCVIGRVPVEVELGGHLRDRSAPPIWTVAHLVALLVNRQFLGAIRWSASTQVLVGHRSLGQRALFCLGPTVAPRTAHVARVLHDHQRDVGTTALVARDAHDLEATPRGSH